MKTIKLAMFAAAFGGTLACANAGTELNTVPSWNGSGFINAWGGGGTYTYGETFVDPAGATALNNFTFYVQGPASSTINYVGEVYNWGGNLFGGNGGSPVGAATFTSAPLSTLLDGGFDAITINTGSLALTPGSQYVIDLTDINSSDPETGWGAILYLNGLPNDGGGGFAFSNNQPSSAPWDNFGNFGDLAFQANFNGNSVPDTTSTVGLLMIAVICLAVARRRLAVA